jgi:hypothetical protein
LAVVAVTLQPSTDIHLVLQPAARATLQLDALAHDDAVIAPSSVRAQCTFTVANTAIATVTAAGVLTPVAAGRTFLTVERTPATGPTTHVVARIFVHPGIADWWIGNNHGTVHADESDLLLSAYALFHDDNVGDITGHGYATFTSLGTNATVDAKGRVTGVTAGDATIRGTLDGTDRDVVVTVLPAAATLRSIVEPVRLSGPMGERRNVLFLAEGFKDKSKFSGIVQKIVDRFVSSRIHEPYRILRDDVNYWMAFEPSSENGLTPGPLVNTNGLMFFFDMAPVDPAHSTFYQLMQLVGLPTDDIVSAATRADADVILHALNPAYLAANFETAVFDYWKSWGQTLLQARDSRYGLMYARRLGDLTFTAAPTPADNSWYFDSVPPHSLLPDVRRSPPNVSRWNNVYNDFLGSLRTSRGASDPNFVIGPRWQRDADDQALVVFIVNDEVYGALAQKQIYSSAAVDLKMFFSKISPLAAIAAGNDHEPDTSGFLTEALVSTVAHELSHQFFLGDEYEGGAGHTVIVDPADVRVVELEDNLTTLQTLVAGTPPLLVPDRIKWNRLLRVTQASMLSGPAVNGPGANIQVPLVAGEGKRWKAGDVAFVRSRNINAAATFSGYPLYRRHALSHRTAHVESVAGDVVTVDGGHLAAGEGYPARSTLYMPKPNKAGSDVLRLVLPGVRTFMNGPPSRPLFDKGGQCDIPQTVLVLPPAISGIVLTSDDQPRVIGLYEGGGLFNCGVYRPAPVCKMRDHVWPRIVPSDPRTQRRHFRFCFVCRYTIVNEVNPRRHPDLDLLYPGREA